MLAIRSGWKESVGFFIRMGRVTFDRLAAKGQEMPWISVDNKSSLSDHLAEFKIDEQGCHMGTVEQLDSLIEIAQQIGYRVRYDYFGGTGGGLCQVNGAKWLFIDVALSTMEQVERLTQALSEEPLYHVLATSVDVARAEKAA